MELTYKDRFLREAALLLDWCADLIDADVLNIMLLAAAAEAAQESIGNAYWRWLNAYARYGATRTLSP
jgi:hypothetical protein